RNTSGSSSTARSAGLDIHAQNTKRATKLALTTTVSNAWTVDAQASGNFGPRRSDFEVARYSLRAEALPATLKQNADNVGAAGWVASQPRTIKHTHERSIQGSQILLTR